MSTNIINPNYNNNETRQKGGGRYWYMWICNHTLFGGEAA